jgi:LAGLIDADG endonuclease
MLSIGVLGFIVWSYLVASLLDKNSFYLIINIFIQGWYTLKLYNTFYSINLYNYSKLADCYILFKYALENKLIIFSRFWINSLILIVKYFYINIRYIYYDSSNRNKYIDSAISETLHENNFNFNLFRKAYLHYKGKEFIYSDEWLTWFIGFVEGDGAILESKGRLYFVVTQKESKILDEIKNVLEFGAVKYFNKFSRYIVSNNPDCFLLYLLFNGNLVLNSRIIQLNKWYKILLELKKLHISKNFDLDKIPNIIVNPVKPRLKDSWLSGFTDAEGCFSVTIRKKDNKSLCSCRFILDQKDAKEFLLYLQKLFNFGSVNLRNKTNNVYRLTIHMNNPLRKNFSLLIEYFHDFPLKTTKYLNFQLWCKVIDLIKLKKHNSKEGLKLIKKLRTEMNKYIIENKSIGSSKYS